MPRRGLVAILDGFFRGRRDAFELPDEEKKASGLTRGGAGDILSRQRFVKRRVLTSEEAWNLYEGNWVAGNVVDTLAEDMVQAGWRFEHGDAELVQTIQNAWENLRIKKAFYDMVRYGLVEGDGYCAIGIREGSVPDLAAPPKSIRGIDYLHAFPRKYVRKQEPNKDPLSPDFGNFAHYEVKLANGTEYRRVHASRILHFQPFPSSKSPWGNSIYERIYDAIQIIDNAQWSVAQIIYQMVLKVLKIDYGRFSAIAKEREMTEEELMKRWSYDINTLTLFILDKGSAETPPDSLEFPAPSAALGSIEAIRQFCNTLLAGAARIPQARLVGNEQGKLSGAEWDAQTYYARIRAMQETLLLPLIQKVTDYLLIALGEDPSSVNYRIVFNPVFVPTEAVQADIEYKRASTDALYIDRAVLTPDEVREMRFKLGSLMDLLEVPAPSSSPGEVEGAAGNAGEE